MTDSPVTPSSDSVPPALAKAAGWSWRLIVIGALVVCIATIFYELRIITVPIFLAILASTLMAPPAKYLRSKGFRPVLATTTVFLAVLIAFAGLLYVLASPIQDQFSDLGPKISQAVDKVNNWLVTGPLELDQTQLDEYRQRISDEVSAHSGELTTGVVTSATLAAEFVAGSILTLVLTFYFVNDGASLANSVIKRFPGHRQALVRASAYRAFNTLGGYLRGVAATGFVDAFFIGIALMILDVPLVLPLIILTFFGAFFPVVGASVAGALAAAVALVNGGPTDALIIIAVVLVVQQLEGHILQPLLVGRAVALHPVVIIFALGSGAIVAGILGAFVAVPLAAVIAAVAREIDGQEDGTVPLEDAEPGVTA